MILRPDRPREECGVFGIHGTEEAARVTFYGLYALQHRGQESAGIAVSDGEEMVHRKGMGLVTDVFDEAALEQLKGNMALGHVRYSTTGSSLPVNAQPLVIRYRGGHLALAHNGNLINAYSLRRELEEAGSIFQTTVDTEVLAHLIARSRKPRVEEAIVEGLRTIKGGYAFILMTEDRLIGARDPNGIRPLSLGKLGDSWVLASETCAFETIGAENVREVYPGEMVIIDSDGIRSLTAQNPGRPALCFFEYIYFARPDSVLNGLNVHTVRKNLGKALARQAPAGVDLVTGVPDSSISAASGYAEEAGIPYEMGLIKNRYIGRTFISPSQEDRLSGIRIKLNALNKVVAGKRVALIDDSIVRGNTSRHIVRMLREAGAREVHLRISSPPYRHPCYFGIDTSAEGELVAQGRTEAEICRQVGADSLVYLSVEGMMEAVGGKASDYCLACFNGDYPVRLEGEDFGGKMAFEKRKVIDR